MIKPIQTTHFTKGLIPGGVLHGFENAERSQINSITIQQRPANPAKVKIDIPKTFSTFNLLLLAAKANTPPATDATDNPTRDAISAITASLSFASPFFNASIIDLMSISFLPFTKI